MSLPFPLTQILLLIASACGVAYSNRTFGMDGRATFFAGVSTFCWVMVIVLQIGFMLGIHKDQRYFKTPSYSTLIVSIATNSFPVIHGCDTHIRPFLRCPKTAKTGQCSWVASERCWDEKQPHSCTSDTNHFTRKVLYSWLLELGVVFYITDRVKGHLALSRKIHWEMAIKVSEDKNIAAKNFEGTFGQLSNYLKRLSYIKPQIINTN